MKLNAAIFWALIFAIFAAVFFIFFNSRQIFFNKYEPEYFENWYYHSQWNYPQSTRGISDGPLYQFVGYRLVQGENPFNINFEMPPLGKYLYGLTAAYLSNPYWTTVFLYLSAVIVLFLLSQNLFQDRKISLLVILLFATTPFVATQIRETMLDLPLMFLYLVHVWLFVKYLSDKNFKFLVLSGIFLGFATATKPGVYTPLVLILGLPLIFVASKKIFNLLSYSGSVFAGYILAYFPIYFIRHPNPIPWLRLHEKALKFYLAPGQVGQVDHLNQWKGIFLRTYEGWWQPGEKIILSDWSLILPFGAFATFIVLVLAAKEHNLKWIYISGLTFVFLIVNTFIPFWPRYLIPVIPLFVLLISFLFKRYGYVILLLALLNLPLLANSLTTGDMSGDAQAAARFISTRAYRELYRSITPQERKDLPEQSFIDLYETFLEELGTRTLEAKVENVIQSRNYANVKYQIKYITKFGELSHEPTFDFVKVHNQWKLIWKWDYLWSGFNPEIKFIVNEKTIPFLRLESSSGVVMAERDNWKTVYVIPRLMFDWNKHLDALSEITGESTLEIDKRVKTVVPDQYPRFVGYLDPALGQGGITKAISIPGVSLQDTDYAVIPENIQPTMEISKLIKNLRYNQPKLFDVQADVYLENSKGEKTIIPFQKVEQKDVIVRI